MTEPFLRFTHTQGGAHCWIECNIPKSLSGLADDLAKRYQWFRRFPDKAQGYYRDVPVSDGPAVSYTKRIKSPRFVLARLAIAYWALRSVHWWLDSHRVPDRPMPEKNSDYLELRDAYEREGITGEEYAELELSALNSKKADLLNRAEEEAERQVSRLLIWLEKAAKDHDGGGNKPTTKTPPPRLTVDLAKKTITLDGIPYEVGSENALRWVKVLSDHPSEWISSTQLEQHDKELLYARTDRWRRHLPQQILDLIDSDTGKGSRLRLA